jgi:hypothetical protein
MIERTALPDALLVDRALAAFARHAAGSGLFFRQGIKAQQAFEAAFGIIRKKQVRARS